MSKEHDDHEAFKLVSPLYSFCDSLESAGEAVWNLDQFIAREPRLVRFPKNKPLGDLYISSPSALNPGRAHRRELGRALGEVMVPAVKKLELVMDKRTARNLKPLRALGPGDLQALNLNSCGITDDDLVHLRGLTRLESLELSCNQITGHGLAHLSEMKFLDRLELWGTDLTDEGLSHLPALPLLRELALFLLLEVTSDALTHLSKLPKLENLDLHSTYLDDSSLPHLARLTTLRFLNLTHTRVSA